MTDLTELKVRLLADRKVLSDYEAQAAEFAIAQQLIGARTRAGLTQREVAERMRTRRSAVAKLESGRTTPSTRMLTLYAEATGCRAVIKLERLKP